ncbi:MAG TPA: hypothetical protein VJ793_04655 [Anaerolineae bacterium]|nr:hypothetical protein [Anaerolineae bacterium]
MNWQRALPTVASIVIILLVTFLRERSRTAAGIIAVMPINVPLALWIVSGAAGTTSEALAQFTRGLFVALIPGLIWLTVAYYAFRAGWSLGVVLLSAYLVWGALLGLAFAVGWLSFD